ncbi:hypothetical protein CC1G_09408 [Coprinopsis cinerea okayama7|uniref:Uncharacterized protein n=1 Tax=Coprinopsis cinerea (strain Okayama-7 / 130 / ATCC MYA-4618 / FGSC 9003) TaxID=240176 RepID=A8NIH0_COPC7|nr:hypothetical protein CC1G_09408 [Coprinopsis cinerea okayama7\|eukprot:XP_001833994.2 hypothetical protein CC1G_09408 [Coprinopsis cinerea okayama7\
MSASPRPTGTTLPRDMFTFICGTALPDYTIHCLAKNGRTVVFQSNFKNSLGLPDTYGPEDFTVDVRLNTLAHVYETLQSIQTLLNAIDVENANWVYVNRKPNGELQLLPCRKPFYKMVKCPLWSQSIYEHEIEISRWNDDCQANGFWDGKPVDIWYGWDKNKMRIVNRAMEAAYAVRDLDLTYEVYGHLLDSDGHVLGLVTEATWGRPVRLEDRIQVYEAIAKLQRHFCLFFSIGADCVLIAGGKVRLADLASIEYVPADDRHDFDRRAEKVHWGPLDDLFTDLELGIPRMAHYQFTVTAPLLFLPTTPSPERPITARVVVFATLWKPYSAFDDDTGGDFKHPMDINVVISQKVNTSKANFTSCLLRISDLTRGWILARTSFKNPLRQERPSIQSAHGTTTRSRPYTRKRASNRRVRNLSPASDCTSESGSTSGRFEEIF